MIKKIFTRRYNPEYTKGHIKDELKILIDGYNEFCFKYNIQPKVNLYMSEITYWELCEDMGCVMMFDPTFNSYGRIFSYNIKIDNRIAPHVFELREEDNMAREYCKNDVDGLDAFRYSIQHLNIGGRGNGKTLKTLNPLPKRYIINEGATILFWHDDSKTIVKRAEDDIQDPVKGFLWAYFLKHSGLSRTKANKYLRDLTKED